MHFEDSLKIGLGTLALCTAGGALVAKVGVLGGLAFGGFAGLASPWFFTVLDKSPCDSNGWLTPLILVVSNLIFGYLMCTQFTSIANFSIEHTFIVLGHAAWMSLALFLIYASWKRWCA